MKNKNRSKIPSDWGRVKLGEIGGFLKGNGLLKEQLSSKGIPCVRYGEIYTKHDTVIKNFGSFISKTIAKESIEIKKNDILFTGSGETREDIGKAVAYLKDEVAYAGGDIIILRPFVGVDSYYLSYALQSEDANCQKYKLGEGHSVVHIYPDELRTLQVPLPPLPEQKAIAAVISAWDKAIEATQKLIEQKELRKKALMQQLLSGKKRLKGFSGKWSRVTINDIADDISIRNTSNDQLIVLSCTKYDGLVPSLEYFGRKIFSNDLSTYKVVPKNTFAYATNHIEEGSIGYQRSYEKALISPMYTTFKTKDGIDNEFLFSVLKTHHSIHEYQKRMEGSINRRGGLRWEEFSKIKVNIPSKMEQSAINKLIMVAHKEIDLLRTKVKLLKDQKKGLMQKLLTGQVRVKVK